MDEFDSNKVGEKKCEGLKNIGEKVIWTEEEENAEEEDGLYEDEGLEQDLSLIHI